MPVNSCVQSLVDTSAPPVATMVHPVKVHLWNWTEQPECRATMVPPAEARKEEFRLRYIRS